MSLRLRDRIEGDLVIEVAFTDSTLDLGDRADADVRRAALAAVAAHTGAAPVVMRQVHGARVALVEDPGADPAEADAIVTTRPGTALLARAADCVPVLLADPTAGIVAAVHSGRPGLAAGVVPAAVARMRDLGSTDLVAWVGPHVCGRCYEVPAAMRDEVADAGARGALGDQLGHPGTRPGCGRPRPARGRRGRRRAAGRPLHPRGRRTAVVPSRRRCRHPLRRGDLDAPTMSRAEEIRDGLGAVRERIDRACADAGRDPAEVTLVVVTKFFPASDVRVLADLGVVHVGENRHQEAVEKAAECADLDLTWHFIGGLQSNKAAAVASYADVVESVDRAKVVRGLARGAHDRGHDVDVLLQVSLDPPDADGRSGTDPTGLPALAAAVVEHGSLRLRGLMAVAPLGEDPATAFARLATIHADFTHQHPDATVLSAGMSGDLEAAVRVGATHVRVGSAILGPRPQDK